MSRVTLRRRYRFSASHRYYRPEWSEEENRKRFGKCSQAPGHGHNYRLLIEVDEGEPHPETGFVVDLSALDQVVRETVLEPLDHQQIDHAIDAFAPGRSIPSSENLVLWIVELLRGRLPRGTRLRAVELMEDDDLGARWRDDGTVE